MADDKPDEGYDEFRSKLIDAWTVDGTDMDEPCTVCGQLRRDCEAWIPVRPAPDE